MPRTRSASAGSRLVAETALSMSKIKDAIDAATETITRLGRRSEQIGEVTRVINEIAAPGVWDFSSFNFDSGRLSGYNESARSISFKLSPNAPDRCSPHPIYP